MKASEFELTPTGAIILHKGDKFGRLTVIRRAPRKLGNANVLWLCRCICGGTRITSGTSLISGRTQSCGCLHADAMRKVAASKVTHGMSNHPLFYIFSSMKRRCYEPKDPAYYRYGGRGITICDEWMDSNEAFFKWALDNGFEQGLTLDRYPDNDGPYSPNNCRWATRKQQQRNMSSNFIVEWRGQQKPLMEWIEITGANYKLVWDRLHRGWSVDDAFSRPPRSRIKAAA